MTITLPRLDEIREASPAIAETLQSVQTQINAASMAHVIAYHNTTQTIATGTDTVLNLNSDDVDVTGMHDTSTGINSRITIPRGQSGQYVVYGFTRYANNATGLRWLYVLVNGSYKKWETVNNLGASVPTTVKILWEGELVAGDYVQLAGFQDSGGNLDVGNVGGRYIQTELIVRRVI